MAIVIAHLYTSVLVMTEQVWWSKALCVKGLSLIDTGKHRLYLLH